MELQHLKTMQCPICGCTTIIKESIDIVTLHGRKVLQHTNGELYEHRRFLCGMELKYIPNFREEKVIHDCVNDPTVIARIEKQKEDKEKVLKLLNENDIDETIIQKVMRYAL